MAYDVTGRDFKRREARLPGAKKEEDSEGAIVPGVSDTTWKLRPYQLRVSLTRPLTNRRSLLTIKACCGGNSANEDYDKLR
jgi:hypothetical protein